MDKFPELTTALAGILDHLAAEVLELAGRTARDSKSVRITTRHIYYGILSDRELSRLLVVNDIHWASEDVVNYSAALLAVNKSINPAGGITAEALVTLNKICDAIAEKMAREVGGLSGLSSMGDVIRALCQKILTGDLVRHSESEAVKFLIKARESGETVTQQNKPRDGLVGLVETIDSEVKRQK